MSCNVFLSAVLALVLINYVDVAWILISFWRRSSQRPVCYQFVGFEYVNGLNKL